MVNGDELGKQLPVLFSSDRGVDVACYKGRPTSQV